MDKLLLLCVDDERDVLDSVVRDLGPFTMFCEVEATESVAEAREVIEEYQAESVPLALILCDHIMPEETGILSLSSSTKTAKPRRVKRYCSPDRQT